MKPQTNINFSSVNPAKPGVCSKDVTRVETTCSKPRRRPRSHATAAMLQAKKSKKNVITLMEWKVSSGNELFPQLQNNPLTAGWTGQDQTLKRCDLMTGHGHPAEQGLFRERQHGRDNPL